jgi:signal transduction histidine kinase
MIPRSWRARVGRLTVPAIFTTVLAVVTVLVLAGGGVVAYLVHRTAVATDELSARIQPARAEALRLQNALINQETGVRGYSTTADRQFLQPYTDGLETERVAVERMVELVGDHDELVHDLDEIETAAGRWRAEYAEPLVAGVTPGEPRAADERTARRGKQVFDRIRVLFDEQDAAFGRAVQDGRDDLVRIRNIRSWVLLGVGVAFLVATATLGLLVRRLVIRPMDRLRTTSEEVAGGAFDRSIDLDGPPDVRAVAAAVEAMRRRIVQELDSSLAQQERLERQTAVLDAQALELRRSNNELEQFAYVASHDLQEPLRKVASFCQLLEKRYGDQLDERGKQYVDFAVDGAKRMQVLINDLLTFSRVGRVTDSSEPVSLDAALDSATANLQAAVEDAGAQVVRPSRLPEVVGDPTLFSMLWQNLVGNAIKFRRPDRPPVVEVATRRRDGDDGPEWEITVTDNGIGVDPEFADKVFVIFQRLHSRESYSGTGIGLALCKKIVEHHGGRIWIDTDHTDGTRFCFTLPVAPEPTPVTASPRGVAEGDRA